MTTETPEQRERRMYSAGYRNGRRLAHVPGVVPKKRETDEHLISLGANVYAEAFEDGHAGRPPRLELQPEKGSP